MVNKSTHTTNDKKSISQKVGKKDLSAEVMKTIEAGDVSMHSRSYFVVLSILAFVSVFLTSLLAAIAVNLAVRDVDYARRYRFDEFGPAARNEFLAAFPWGLVVLTLLLVVATVLLARRLDFSYKHRLQTVTAFVLGGIISLGVVISILNLNRHIESAPPFRPLQTLKERADRKILSGTIQDITDEGFSMQLKDGRSINVVVDDSTYQRGSLVLRPGEPIGVFIDEDSLEEQTVRALGLGQSPRQKGSVRGWHTPPRTQN